MRGAVVIADCGDSAVMAKATGSDDRAWQAVHALADAVEAARLDGVHGIVPTYDTLLVEFDCSVTDHDTIRRALRGAGERLACGPAPRTSPRRFTVPVVYGGEYGPDLPVVAEQLGLAEREVVALHTAEELTVRCLGAPVGAPMMDGPAFPEPVPRLASPRVSVPPGSIAVAGRQAVICPMRSPGGWPLLGRTPLRVLDLDAEPPAPYRPGDVFRFVPITPDEWHRYDGVMLTGEAVAGG